MDCPERILKIANDQKFIKNFDDNFNFFDENGILEGECPQCSPCGKGFLNLEIPDPKKLIDMLYIEASKQRMKFYLEKHIQKEIDENLSKIRSEIEEKVRNKYISIKPESSEVF